MGPLPSLMKLQLRPNHEKKLNSDVYHVLPHFTLFSVGRRFSGQAWMELLCTLTVFPVRQLERRDAREYHIGQQSISHIAIVADGH